MIPLSDGIPARRFPYVNVALIVANFAVWIFFFITRVPAWIFLGVWFAYQLVEANFGLLASSSAGGGVAFFAHVGGFVFGFLVAKVAVAAAGRREPVPV